ncbi:uncharacterized protein LOC100845684 isoform X2 [Brachypodium distachyon]|uniref:Uncharacterized protein n=1 Tax=Brachypodium distachyon TaxID=15368 RepID=A0A0Q3GG88_BRADI|nr:uncharacterized protein LOC100845684 isoform X2 [Brachypodium distachyon]KQK09379.1 hypothetical protein BRADI_2g47650v3 [Brachypodium distachyon]KQK09381.1 hypothetical protein BRADI_2g47650v3 [Brachypodium distachyon]PNT72673.1 hypothetical protein BRADI_2g47650v3 [Brachypodium distachyon]|eukprot:XP_014753518.1 uncharacterized protein LOC100845684 isoform X2 [Brachypodium distachyon]
MTWVISQLVRSVAVQGVNGSRMHYLGTMKGLILRGFSNRDRRLHIKRVISFTATDKQEPIASPTSDTPLLEDAESSTADSTKSDGSYFSERGVGKSGFISFHGGSSQTISVESVPHPGKEASRLVWFVGPTILVAFLVLPSLYLRKVLSAVFEDSLLTDFLILFFTEALFYGGVGIFVLLIDKVWRPLQQVAPKSYIWSKARFFRISSVTTMVLSLIIPLLTMGMVWPWTGPAASATLAPYLVGLVVQFAFEQYARHRKSPSWPVIPIIFKVYRLHQLNRAAQLVTALTFSVRGTEATNQTLAIMNSLGALLTVLQILGIICVWSLSSFLMRFLPSSDIPDP